MKKNILAIILLVSLCFGLASCGMANKDAKWTDGESNADPVNTQNEIGEESEMDAGYSTIEGGTEINDTIEEGETGIIENDFIKASLENISTFSANVNTATYSYFRKLVNAGYTLEQLKNQFGKSFRTEEMVNYFSYDLDSPANNDLFGATVQIAPTPWNQNSVLMMLGLKTKDSTVHSKNNLVFLIDVSGSMYSNDKLPLLQKTFSHLVEQLGTDDVVSIVTYASGEKVVLEGCEGNKSNVILNAINSLSAGGSTNGEAGIQKAYAIAEEYFIEGGNNRIILATDGDLNVGISTPTELRELVSEKKDGGVYLSVLGYGTGNYRDDMLEAIAHDGNGIYYYIDGEAEAEKIFTTDLFSSLYTVANDVKLQINFDPDYINSYRLIGYETRILDIEDFDDDTKDAGEVGTGHAVVVFYELVLEEDTLETDDAWMKLAVRYKNPGATESILNEYNIGKEAYTVNPNDDFLFASAVIETSMVLTGSKHKGNATLNTVLSTLDDVNTNDYYKKEFKSLVEKIK